MVLIISLLLLLPAMLLAYTEVTNRHILIEHDFFAGEADVEKIAPVYRAVRQRFKEACNGCAFGRDFGEIQFFCAPCVDAFLADEPFDGPLTLGDLVALYRVVLAKFQAECDACWRRPMSAIEDSRRDCAVCEALVNPVNAAAAYD
jgi:hypothetical protein